MDDYNHQTSILYCLSELIRAYELPVYVIKIFSSFRNSLKGSVYLEAEIMNDTNARNCHVNRSHFFSCNDRTRFHG